MDIMLICLCCNQLRASDGHHKSIKLYLDECVPVMVITIHCVLVVKEMCALLWSSLSVVLIPHTEVPTWCRSLGDGLSPRWMIGFGSFGWAVSAMSRVVG
jgi:hypothetical protein